MTEHLEGAVSGEGGCPTWRNLSGVPAEVQAAVKKDKKDLRAGSCGEILTAAYLFWADAGKPMPERDAPNTGPSLTETLAGITGALASVSEQMARMQERLDSMDGERADRAEAEEGTGRSKVVLTDEAKTAVLELYYDTGLTDDQIHARLKTERPDLLLGKKAASGVNPITRDARALLLKAALETHPELSKEIEDARAEGIDSNEADKRLHSLLGDVLRRSRHPLVDRDGLSEDAVRKRVSKFAIDLRAMAKAAKA